MKILSFSVAAYNVERYIERTLESLISCKNIDFLEIIVVNDGSKDNTKKIIEKYKDAYPSSIRFIDKENGGHGSTINAAINIATGKYFKVLDGDDWVNSENVDTLVDNLLNEDTDLVLTNYTKAYECHGNQFRYDKVNIENVPMQKTLVKNIQINTGISMHAIAIKTSILQENNVSLPEHCFYVDALYDTYSVAYSETVKFYDLNIYMYRLGRKDQSVSMDSAKKNISMYEKVLLLFFDFINKAPQNLIEEKKYLLCRRLLPTAMTIVRVRLAQRNRNAFEKLQNFYSLANKKNSFLSDYFFSQNIFCRISLKNFKYFLISSIISSLCMMLRKIGRRTRLVKIKKKLLKFLPI